jgi:hypothetical protein
MVAQNGVEQFTLLLIVGIEFQHSPLPAHGLHRRRCPVLSPRHPAACLPDRRRWRHSMGDDTTRNRPFRGV